MSLRLTAAERHQLLIEWNDTARHYPSHKCIHELFEEQVERSPNAIAVIFGDDRVTYADLNARANKLAHHLQSLGVGPEVLVGLCVERSIELIVAILSILKAGGAYVPLDLTYPGERIAYILTDARVKVLLTQMRSMKNLPRHDAHVVCLDGDPLVWMDKPSVSPSVKVLSENAAYVMYTSGSTGNPKGVCILHRGVVRLVKNANFMNIGPADTFLQLAPTAFDASTLEIWGSLLNGGKLVIHRVGPLDFDDLAQTIGEHDISTLWLTAGLFNQFVEQHANALANVGHVLVGGDVVSPEYARVALRHMSGVLINGYGPTENTTFTACHKIGLQDTEKQVLPIGRPISNTQVFVLDPNYQLVPAGATGELYAAGDGLAREYVNRRGLTAERFVPNPFSAEPGARMYRTGDLVRWNHQGQLEFLGRIDYQVKIRGFRIELGEIEITLSSHASVRECVVVVREDRPGDKRLVAYVVPIDNSYSLSALRAYVAATLPEYMIPSAFVFLGTMPLTPNGKIDRKALPAPEFDRAVLSTRFVAATTRIEAMLTRIWTNVLGLDSIGIHDNFFEMGGNSLLSIRLISSATKAGLSLTIRQLFESPTIDGLAKSLATNKADKVRCLVSMRASGSEIPLVLTPGVAGTSLVFLPLRDTLRVTMPVWSFNDPHLVGNPVPPETVEDLARMWVSELLDAMPNAPAFRLGGYSFGGMVAVEMARQLIALGKRVECVLIIDGGLPNNDVPFDPLAFLDELARKLGALEAVRNGVLEADIEEVLGRVAMALGTWQDSRVEDPHAWARAALVTAENNHQRMLRWQVRPVDVPIVLLRASKDNRVADLGWSNELAHPVQSLFVPGDHQTMMELPFVQTLAYCIEGLLTRYDSNAIRQDEASHSSGVAQP